MINKTRNATRLNRMIVVCDFVSLWSYQQCLQNQPCSALAQGQCYDWLGASEVTLKYMGQTDPHRITIKHAKERSVHIMLGTCSRFAIKLKMILIYTILPSIVIQRNVHCKTIHCKTDILCLLTIKIGMHLPTTTPLYLSLSQNI